MTDIQVKVAGAWKAVPQGNAYVKVGGVWKVLDNLFVKISGVWKPILVWNTNPPAPTAVTITPINNGDFQVTVDPATNAEADYLNLDIETTDDGGAVWDVVSGSPFAISATQDAVVGPYTVPQSYAHGSTARARARARDTAGLVSSYTQSSTTTTVDSVPNPAASIDSVTWTGSAFRVQWDDTPTPFDNAVVTVEVWRTGASGPVKVWEGAWTGASNRFVDVAMDGYNFNHVFEVRTVNRKGASSSGTATAWSPRQPGTNTVYNPTVEDTWSEVSGWRNETEKIRSGRFDGNFGLQEGFVTYGTQVFNDCHGFTPASCELLLIRYDSEGFGEPPRIYRHNHNTKPAGQATPNGLDFGFVPPDHWFGDNAKWVSVDTTTGWSAGTTKGFIYRGQSTAQAYYNVWYRSNINGFANLLRLYW